MGDKKISELPKKPYTKLAMDIQKRGIELSNGEINKFTDVMIIGMLDAIRELTERLDAADKIIERVAKKIDE